MTFTYHFSNSTAAVAPTVSAAAFNHADSIAVAFPTEISNSMVDFTIGIDDFSIAINAVPPVVAKAKVNNTSMAAETTAIVTTTATTDVTTSTPSTITSTTNTTPCTISTITSTTDTTSTPSTITTTATDDDVSNTTALHHHADPLIGH